MVLKKKKGDILTVPSINFFCVKTKNKGMEKKDKNIHVLNVLIKQKVF